jgi:hypothetical protein
MARVMTEKKMTALNMTLGIRKDFTPFSLSGIIMIVKYLSKMLSPFEEKGQKSSGKTLLYKS